MAPNKIEYRLTFGAGLQIDNANHIKMRMATILEQVNFGALVIQFSSEGGSTDQSLALHNFISSLPVPVHMHAMGHVGSAAVPVFLAGTKRTCAPLSRFFFHEYNWTFAGAQTLRTIDEASRRLRADIDTARKIIRRHTEAGDDILNALDGTSGPVILDPTKAKEFGFVDDVVELGDKGADGMNVAVWT